MKSSRNKEKQLATVRSGATAIAAPILSHGRGAGENEVQRLLVHSAPHLSATVLVTKNESARSSTFHILHLFFRQNVSFFKVFK